MSKFNTVVKTPKVTNLAGGPAFAVSQEMELVQFLLTSFASDQFYRSEDQARQTLVDLVAGVQDKQFVAKTAIFARDQFGMRSVTHIVAAELAKYISGQPWAKSFYDKVVSRVDDMTEIVACYKQNSGAGKVKFPNSMKRGFAAAFDRFDDYQLAKYRAANKGVKLVDIVNICHPVPTDRNRQALQSLISNDLKATQTWEAMLSKAGQEASSEDELMGMKADAWKSLLAENRLPYFAALRNIRNILTQAPDCTDALCAVLTNQKMIQNSKILPFRFAKAYEEVQKIGSDTNVRKVLSALNQAMDYSVKNVPQLEDLLVVVDVSGSMSGKPSDIASLFAAMLCKSNGCDVMVFDTKARYQSYDPNDSVMRIRQSFHFSGGGTNVNDVFLKANKPYKHIILLSDFQTWLAPNPPTNEFAQWAEKFGCDPWVYSWDLQGYGTAQFKGDKVFCLAGFSDKVFDIIKMLKEDKAAMMNQIRGIDL